jgi:hypothetical protein
MTFVKEPYLIDLTTFQIKANFDLVQKVFDLSSEEEAYQCKYVLNSALYIF